MHPSTPNDPAGSKRRVPKLSTSQPLRRLLLSISAVMIATGALAQSSDPAALSKYDTNHNGRIDPDERAAMQVAESTPARSADETDEPVQLSPFEVVDSNRGYMATNTMSGTRVNTKLADIASSISVVTKAQMEDFAMLDVNDIFSYEAGTEGSGNYTDFTVNASGQPEDNLAASPSTANRVRGLSSANVSLNGFETSRRVPVDKITVDSVEVSRGPNSNLFGLGNASGTVNMVPARAKTGRNSTQLQLRGDALGSYRESLDVNRVVLKDKLALRFTQVFQDDEYQRKPSGVTTERYNGMITYRPFKSTTIYGTFQYYHAYGHRPNSVTPRDAISPWVAAGSPTWDPTTGIAYIDGKVAYNNKGKIPSYFTSAFQTTGRGTSLMFIGQDGVDYWTAPRGITSPTSPFATLDQTAYNYVFPATKTLRATQPLWATDDAVSDKSIYDWSSINAIASNMFNEQVNTTMVGIDQFIFNTPRQQMAAQLSWFREDSPTWEHYFPNGSSGSTYLYIDPNMKRLDGTPNPFFLRPYFGSSEVITRDQPLLNDTLRAQLSYTLDLTKEKNWLKWLGLHQVTAFGEYKHFATRTYASQDVMVSNNAWLTAGMPRANSVLLLGDTLPQDAQSPTATRSFEMYYVGDANGLDMDYAPYSGPLAGTYNYTWGNFHAGQAINDPVTLGRAATINGTAGSANQLKIQKTQGAVLQSHLFNDRLVTTFGLRKDRVYTKQGVNAQLLPDGMTHDVIHDELWAPGDYKTNQGMTRTEGAVLKLTSWLSAYANKSDSFIPADPAINLHGQLLPNPQGKGEDWGLMLNLFDGKLFLRANQFITKTANDRNSASTTYAVRAIKMDIFDGQPSRAFSLDNVERMWIQQANPNISPDQLQAQVATAMKMDPQLIATLENAVNFNPGYIAEPEEALSKGREFEVTYNPKPFWTMKLNVTQLETIQSAVAQDLLDYLNERMPVWNSITDPTYNMPWYSELITDPATGKVVGAYGSQPQSYLSGNVTTPLQVTLAKVGKSLPQVRKYRVNYMTNFGLNGITENRFLKAMSIGGALRWEDRGAIGYYGVQQPPEVVTELDVDRPVWDRAHLYVDLFANYRTKLFNRVGTKIQFNIRNLNEQGHLQPVAAFPDGKPYAYRIIDPTQYLLTVTFDF